MFSDVDKNEWHYRIDTCAKNVIHMALLLGVLVSLFNYIEIVEKPHQAFLIIIGSHSPRKYVGMWPWLAYIYVHYV